jgi:hypothetical protein
MGLLNLNDLKKFISTYGEVLDKNNLQLFEKVFDTIGDKKITISGMIYCVLYSFNYIFNYITYFF